MKRIYTSVDIVEAGMLKNMIRKAGIQCVERNEQMAQTLPTAAFRAELWVENDADYAEAAALVNEWRHPSQIAGVSWVCPRCGEKMEGQFGKCWKCGTHKSAQK